ncbi:carbonic anhydrase 9 isoform X2 [Neoarius graeffei]|uniref:carbonic anhydrase 9 isoform X2 n=1 Tax=Neoarius graeffei TaxID=443677 RepID=UPI00298D16BD|nr:carbonic anhydrase 9 isoform X2 [Neoarius graeffei]
MLLELFITLLLIHSQVSGDTSSSEEEEENVSSEHEDEHKKSSSHADHWGYHDQRSWHSDFTDCSGKSQSPIDIVTRDASYDARLPAIKLDGYDLSGDPELTLTNNGHTLQLQLPNTMRIVKGFEQVYLAAQLHFHWGTMEVPGSEHTIDNVHFPAELHVVHYNSKYGSLKEAENKPDGLAVLGAFIGIGLHENENYDKILSVIKDVSSEESDTKIPSFNIRYLLPNSLEKFYRYTGSLTTPPCYQSVNWTVFNDTITVSRKQLAALERTLKAGQNQSLNENFRAPQNINGRRILASFPILHTAHAVSSGTTSSKTSSQDGLSRGDILAIAFGALFAMTLLFFIMYAYQQRQKHSKFNANSRQNVIYKPATKEDV